MRIHSVDKIKELKRLRRKGLSINELVAKLFIPKTTVWHHVHNVKVSTKYKLMLKSKQGGSAKRRQKNLEKAQKYAQKLLKKSTRELSIRELSIIIAMLYWGEGNKKRCEFINSDGKIIKTYLIILRNIFNIQKDFIKPTLRIYSGMSEKECLNYWACITKIPKHEFIVRLNDGGTKGRTTYGMCRITVKRGSNVLKLIQSLINQIFEEVIKKY